MRVVRIRRTWSVYAAFVAVCAPVTGGASAAIVYNVTRLADMGFSATGTTNYEAQAITNGGIVAGMGRSFATNPTGDERGVRWDTPSTFTLLPPPAGRSSPRVLGVNDARTSVGYVNAGPGAGARAVIWDAVGNPVELPHLGTTTGGFTQSRANAVNGAGTTVGFAQRFANDLSLGDRALRWDAAGNMTELPGIEPTTRAETNVGATDINEGGTVVGYSTTYSGGLSGDLAVRWDANGTLTQLAPLFVDRNNNTLNSALGVNEANVTVGTGFKDGTRPVKWNADGSVVELAVLSVRSTGFSNAWAEAINGDGLIVGRAENYLPNGSAELRATMWDASGSILDLNTLIPADSGWILRQAWDVNDDGWIVGSGAYDPDGPGGAPGYSAAFLLRPVPEPSLLGILVPLVFLGRRRSN